MNDPMVGAMLKLTHQIGDYKGAQGDNVSKNWAETYQLLAERAIAHEPFETFDEVMARFPA